MRHLLALLMLTTSLASPVVAQSADSGLSGYTLSADIGLGIKYGPSYMGSDKSEASPWFILRNGILTRPGGQTNKIEDGFTILPSVNYIAKRDANDHDILAGTDKIKAAGELGFRMTYDIGATESYLALRKGFGGHDGLAGEFGARYRFQAADQLWLWTGAEARFGSDDFTNTYFGVTDAEEGTSNLPAYKSDGGVYAASLGVGARYAITPDIAMMGELEYTRLLGDAADSPLVTSKGEPRVKLGVVRRFDFRF